MNWKPWQVILGVVTGALLLLEVAQWQRVDCANPVGDTQVLACAQQAESD